MTMDNYKLAQTSKDSNVLISLSRDKSAIVRCYVALNINTPIDVLINLSKDKNANVRWNVALNINTTIEALINILKKDKSLKDVIVKHPNAKTEIGKEKLFPYIFGGE